MRVTCEACKHWRPTEGHAGQCRKFAPRPELHGVYYQIGSRASSVWPLTDQDDWCGEGEAA